MFCSARQLRAVVIAYLFLRADFESLNLVTAAVSIRTPTWRIPQEPPPAAEKDRKLPALRSARVPRIEEPISPVPALTSPEQIVRVPNMTASLVPKPAVPKAAARTRM